jgi:tetratricopeptide (TPR) repeat protein
MVTSANQNLEEHDKAKEIVEILGYFPLAISQAGAYISVQKLQRPMEEYINIYKRNARSMLAQTPAPATWDYRNDSVFTTWEISFTAIEQEMPEAAKLLLLCGFFAKEDLWEELIRHGSKLPEDGRILPHKSCMKGRLTAISSDLSVRHSIKKLLSYSLIKCGSSTEGFSLHPLVHFWAQERLNVKRRAELSREALLILYHAFNFARHDSNRWNFEVRVAPHLDAVMENVLRYCSTYDLPQYAPKPPELGRSHLDFYRCLDRTYGWLLWGYAAFEERLLNLRQSFRPTLDLGLKTWQLAYRLGTVYQDLRLWKAAERLYNWTLVEAWHNCPQWHPRALEIVGSLAWVILNRDRFDEALEWYTWALEARETVLGKDHPSTIATLYGIGLTLERDDMEAYEHHFVAFTKTGKALGPNDYFTTKFMSSMKRLANGREKLHHLNEFLTLRSDILAWENRTFSVGQSNILEGTALLARNYIYRERPEEAEELILQLVGNHTSLWVINLMDSIAWLYHQKGNKKGASAWYLKARDDARRVFGENNDVTVIQELHLAQYQRYVGQLDNSLQSYFQVLSNSHEAYSVWLAMKGIGEIINGGHLSRKVITYLREALAHMSDQDQVTRDLTKLLGDALKKQGLFKNALRKYQTVATWDRTNSQEDTESHLEILVKVGEIYWRLNRYREALKTYQKTLALSTKLYGEDHIFIKAIMEEIARTYFELRDFAKALEWWGRIVSPPLRDTAVISWIEEDIDYLITIGRANEAFELQQLLEEARVDFSSICLNLNSPFVQLLCAAW